MRTLQNSIVINKKVPSAHQLPCPSILRGKGFSFSCFCIIIILWINTWMYYKRFLQTITKKYCSLFIHVPQKLKILTGWLTVVTPLMAVLCMPVPSVGIWSLFLSAAILGSIQPLGIFMPNFTPGFICVLHTLGRPLEWNPHIHCLISECGHSDDGEWRNTHYIAKHWRSSA